MTKDMINNDPFCDVRLTPLQTTGARASDKTVIEILSEDQRWEQLPGVGAVHGAGYSLVPNRHLYDLVGDVLTRTDGDFQPILSSSSGVSSHLHWDGKRFSAKWMSKSFADKVGDSTVALGVEVINSYDGSWPVGVKFFAMHMLCANQFHLQNLIGNFVFRHLNTEAGENIIRAQGEALNSIQSRMQKFVDVIPVMRELRNRSVGGFNGFLSFRSSINQQFWPETKEPLVLDALSGTGDFANMPDVCLDHALPAESYWSLLNGYTAVTTHCIGGLRGDSLSDQVTGFVTSKAGVAMAA